MRSCIARVGWGSTLGNTLRLLVRLTPSASRTPLTDMTTVASVALHVERSNGEVETWTTTQVGTATADLAVFAHLYGEDDLVEVETLRVTALMTLTNGKVVPSDPFEIDVQA